MNGPKRIQRRRTKGWRIPEGAIYVGRPSRWQNIWPLSPANPDRSDVVKRFREGITPEFAALVRLHLRGKDLLCWCPLDQPCHADVLLEIANS